jgi:hypothetical protein
MSLKIKTYRNQNYWQYDFTHQKKRYRGWIAPVSMMTEKDAQNIYELKVHETIALGIKSPVHILPVKKEKPVSKEQVSKIVQKEIQTALKKYSAGLSLDEAQTVSSLLSLGIETGMKLSRIIDNKSSAR